jgi:hypothetical protein
LLEHIFGARRKRVIRVDPSKDFLFLDDSDPYLDLGDCDEALLLKLKNDLEAHGLRCQDVRHLGVETTWGRYDRHFLLAKNGMAATTILEFENLEPLTVFSCK